MVFYQKNKVVSLAQQGERAASASIQEGKQLLNQFAKALQCNSFGGF